MPIPNEVLQGIKDRVAKAKELIKDLEPEIERAKKAGIDVEADEKRLRELKDQVRLLELQYVKSGK